MIARLRSFLSSRYSRLALGVLIAGASLYLALRRVSFEEVTAVFLQADLLLVSGALASVAANNVAKAARWKTLLGRESRKVSLTWSLMVILASQALNTLYPARVGDLSRVYIGGEKASGRAFVLGTVVLEKLFDMLSYVVLFLILFLLIPLPSWVNQSVIFFVAITFAGIGLVLFLVYRLEWFTQVIDRYAHRLPGGIQSRVQAWLHSGLESLDIFYNRRALLLVAFWSLLVWATAVLTNHLTLLALDIRLPMTAPILVLIVLQISMSIPAVPGRIGIFEYLCILSLAVFGIPQAPALSYGILLHIVALLPQTLIGLVCVGALGMDHRSAVLEEYAPTQPTPYATRNSD